jgi:hypothetical protein
MTGRGFGPGSSVTEREAWTLEDFEPRLDQWIEMEKPSDNLRILVTAWVLSRFDDPYAGVRREPDFDNLWFGPVPGSLQEGRVVVCSYWIFEASRTVRCDSIATLNLPV